MTHAPKIAAQKKQPISILRDEKYLTYTADVTKRAQNLQNLNTDFFLKMAHF